MTAAVTPPTETVAISVSSPLAPRDVGVALIGSPKSTVPGSSGGADGPAGSASAPLPAPETNGDRLAVARCFGVCFVGPGCVGDVGVWLRPGLADGAGGAETEALALADVDGSAAGATTVTISTSCTPTSSGQCGSISIEMGVDAAANVTGTISPSSSL